MLKAADYQSRRSGAWRLFVLPEDWSDNLQENVLTLAGQEPAAKHPRTLELKWPISAGEKRYFIKVFYRPSVGGTIKDLFRPSKALRFWHQGLALSEAGFNVPPTIAAGELRRFRILERAFVLTSKLDGQSLPVYLANLAKNRTSPQSLMTKRSGLMQLAQTVRRLHDQGFVHGDLVASNLFVAASDMGAPIFHFMDNDRTWRYPRWLPQTLWKRNLIQLNRMPLPTITLQDRMRFLCAYLGRSRISGRDRQFARWIESKTRTRRRECDGVNSTMSFRRLMRWDPNVGVTPDA